MRDNDVMNGSDDATLIRPPFGRADMTGSLLVAGADRFEPAVDVPGRAPALARRPGPVADPVRRGVRARRRRVLVARRRRSPRSARAAAHLDRLPHDARLRAWPTCAASEVAAAIVDHGVAALDLLLRDPVHGGWFASVAPDGEPVDSAKAAYPHAFVVLAASTAIRAGRPGARRAARRRARGRLRALLGRRRRPHASRAGRVTSASRRPTGAPTAACTWSRRSSPPADATGDPRVERAGRCASART